jgi:GNAT superfamily N-acetyltransferase
MENAETLGRYNGITFSAEPLLDCLEEIKAQHQLQWDELKQGEHGLVLKPNYDGLLAGNALGKYIVFTARKDGVLVGNCSVWLYESNHTQDLMATEDTLFLQKEFRKGRTGIKFFQYCEEVLKRLGVVEIAFSVSPSNNVWKVWERLGYSIKSYQMAKVIRK